MLNNNGNEMYIIKWTRLEEINEKNLLWRSGHMWKHTRRSTTNTLQLAVQHGPINTQIQHKRREWQDIWSITRVQHYNEYIRENHMKKEAISIRNMNTWKYKVITDMIYNFILGTPEKVEDMNEHQESKANPYQVWRVRNVIRHINLKNATY